MHAIFPRERYHGRSKLGKSTLQLTVLTVAREYCLQGAVGDSNIQNIVRGKCHFKPLNYRNFPGGGCPRTPSLVPLSVTLPLCPGIPGATPVRHMKSSPIKLGFTWPQFSGTFQCI